MPLVEGQWQIRDLVLGPLTPYTLMDDSNPFTVTVRADQGGPRAWNHGSWSGAEWGNDRVVPLRLHVQADGVASWVAAHQQLAAAFAPVGDHTEQVPLRFVLGGTEYVLFGRPRMVEPDVALIGTGQSHTRCAFVAQDPRIYAGTESTVGPVGLTQFAGGLLVPFTVPFTVGGTLSGGIVTLTNAGTTDTGVTLRVDGPAPNPRLVLQAPNGSTQTLSFDLAIGVGQWLDIDSVARTALLNGLPTSNQFGVSTWGWDQHPLAPGVTTLRFFADSFEPAAMVTARFRSAWW